MTVSPVHEFTFEFDRELLWVALRRDHEWRGWVAAALFVAAMLVYGWFMEALAVEFLAVVVVGAVVIWWVFRRCMHRLVGQIYELWTVGDAEPVMTIRLDDQGFEAVLAQGSSRYRWADLRRLWRYDDIWLIEIIRMNSVLFPPSAASNEALEFITDRCRSAGVRV